VEWLNLHISVLDSPQVLRCDPVRRATWLFLLRYCISQENGGVIEDCAAWGDTSWQQIVRVKLREVRAESPLWTWEGDNLRVTFYPSEKESEVQAKRTGGTYGGKAATEAKAQAARENGRKGGRPKTQAETQAPETQEPKLNPTEGNGMERNGIGMEENIRASALHGAANAPIDLPERLRETWKEIMAIDGPEVANRAIIVGRRLFHSPSPAQLLETWKCAASKGRLQDHPDQWPDFRQAMKADRRQERAPGAVQADAETLDLARQWDAQDRQGAKP
jgi:hypothetical protein